MAELVYAFDLKSNGENHMGSSPISGTKFVAKIAHLGVFRSSFIHKMRFAPRKRPYERFYLTNYAC